jgi:lysophospholipase L1-like esterase
VSDIATLAGLVGAAPVAPTTAALAGEIRAFADAHPDVRTVAAFLPVDAATSAARAAVSLFRAPGAPWADTSLRGALRADLGAVPLVDLLPALAAPDSFLDGDYHLSAAGHARVATALAPALAAP